MTVSIASIDHLDSHWAVRAVGTSEARKQALLAAEAQLVEDTVGLVSEPKVDTGHEGTRFLEQLATAYELAAIEGLDASSSTVKGGEVREELREQCAAGAWRAFGILRMTTLPEDDDERMYHVLHISALAYCGDRWSDLRRWYNNHPESSRIPLWEGVVWQRRLLLDLFNCWVRLFRKDGWDDLEAVGVIVARLRDDQSKGEDQILEHADEIDTEAAAVQLLGLYHWAKATELLATYMMQGEPADVSTLLDKHFEAAAKAFAVLGDVQFELLMRWLHVASRQMVSGSIWSVVRSVNSRVTDFVTNVTKHQALFELLPPQKAAVQEQGLLDQAATAVVIDLPTSGGKTLLAEFRILQALNQYDRENGWVAYVAPTRALVTQLTRRLRQDLGPIGVQVEQLSGAVEIDTFEEEMLSDMKQASFQVLVTTPEKLQLVIRNKKVPRPLALVVMDEAHNIENQTRGLRIELLLATIRQEHTQAHFLLLTPYVENADELATWLARDSSAKRTISIGTTPWQPNERIVGMYWAEADDSKRGQWRLKYETITTTRGAISLGGQYAITEGRPLNIRRSTVLKSGKQAGLAMQTAVMAEAMAERGTCIAVANDVPTVWSMARAISDSLVAEAGTSEEIELVRDFIRDDISPDFELVDMLACGVGVHHAGLSDDVRALMEWLAEDGHLRVLCATSTISQGINFPVNSVFLQSRSISSRQGPTRMSSRDFWNLAGRAGRVKHDSVGMVGIAAGASPDGVRDFVNEATGELASRLVQLMLDVAERKKLGELAAVLEEDQWVDFRCYVAHLLQGDTPVETVLNDLERTLRNTFGYGILRDSPERRHMADGLLQATKAYVRKIGKNRGLSTLADTTGFSVDNVLSAQQGLRRLQPLQAEDWLPETLFHASSKLASFCKVMLDISQLSGQLERIQGKGRQHQRIAEITRRWVEGASIQEIAEEFFTEARNSTGAITEACRGIYGSIVNASPWGLSALSQLSDLPFDDLDEPTLRSLNCMPAMVYHGVNTEESVLMRMNSVPRSVAGEMGEAFGQHTKGTDGTMNVSAARNFLRELDASGWERAVGRKKHLSGTSYRRVWGVLSGEGESAD